MDDKIICPLIDDKISPVDCMENRDIRDIRIPDKYKTKENWKEICNNCKYHNL